MINNVIKSIKDIVNILNLYKNKKCCCNKCIY